MMRLMLGLPAPAKLNLFLQVIGRRADGFHELRTGFVAIDLCDTLDFERLDDARIERRGDLTGSVEHDLAVRAARLLQHESACAQGARIDLEKRIPIGGGLGGGSSDAATTLLALNRLWRLNWPRERLADLALRLGADVPFFLQRGPSLGQGVGERLSPLSVPPRWYAVIHPQVHVSTAEIFRSHELTVHLEQAKITGFPESDRGNDLEPIVRSRVPEVDAALRCLSGFGEARMSGSGACVFAQFETRAQAEHAIAGAPAHWSCWAVAGLSEHPLAAW